MKKFLLLAVLVSLIPVASLFADEPSDYYYVNIPIEKIFVYRLGYVVVYRKGAHQMARTYIPNDWFNAAGGKGELIGLSHGKEWPSMSVYYKNGEFSHLRLKVRRERSHESWGLVPRHAKLDEYFEGLEEVKLEF